MIVATSYAPECIEWFRKRAQQKLVKARIEYVTDEVAEQLDSEAEQKRRAELLGAACESVVGSAQVSRENVEAQLERELQARASGLSLAGRLDATARRRQP